MAPGDTAVFATYRDRNHIEQAIDVLINAGFTPDDISVLLREDRDGALEERFRAGVHTNVVVNETLGGLTGIGALAIPGLGPFIAAGPIAGALAEDAPVGLGSALAAIGVPEQEVTRYEAGIQKGRALLSVHCDDPVWTRRAKDVMKLTGAENIASFLS